MSSGCDYSHPFTGMTLCKGKVYGICIGIGVLHIGVGFDAARSTVQGSAKASKRGTGSR